LKSQIRPYFSRGTATQALPDISNSQYPLIQTALTAACSLLLRIQNFRKLKNIKNSSTVELERDYPKDYLLQLLKSCGLQNK